MVTRRERKNLNITVDYSVIKQATEVKYLKATLTEDGRMN